MIALINGEEGGNLALFKAGDESLNIVLLADDGSIPSAFTGDTITARFYDTADRRNAAVKSKAATLTTATAGFSILTLLTADMTFGPGTNGAPYYLFIERDENTGTTVEISRKPTKVYIK